MRELKLPYTAATQMFRRMVFNVIARNCDDHTKNFSFLLKKGASWELAPAYDVCHAYRPDSIWVSQHALSINGKRKGILKKDVLTLAKSMNIKKAEAMVDEINTTVSHWEHFAKEQKVPENKIREIGQTLLNLSN
jgi:serine/threonine-protein kinase HipA